MMPMLRGRDEHGINILAIQQLAMVGVALRLGSGYFQASVQVHAVHVADRAPLHALVLEILHVAATHATRADDAHYQTVVGPEHFGVEGGMRQHP